MCHVCSARSPTSLSVAEHRPPIHACRTVTPRALGRWQRDDSAPAARGRDGSPPLLEAEMRRFPGWGCAKVCPNVRLTVTRVPSTACLKFRHGLAPPDQAHTMLRRDPDGITPPRHITPAPGLRQHCASSDAGCGAQSPSDAGFRTKRGSTPCVSP